MSGIRVEQGDSRIAGRVADGWIVGNKLYAPSLLVTAEIAGTLANITWETLDARSLPDLGPVELLLVGTGATLIHPTEAFVQAANARGYRVEAMDTPAAARTFNVLVAEGRLVGALLF